MEANSILIRCRRRSPAFCSCTYAAPRPSCEREELLRVAHPLRFRHSSLHSGRCGSLASFSSHDRKCFHYLSLRVTMFIFYSVFIQIQGIFAKSDLDLNLTDGWMDSRGLHLLKCRYPPQLLNQWCFESLFGYFTVKSKSFIFFGPSWKTGHLSSLQTNQESPVKYHQCHTWELHQWQSLHSIGTLLKKKGQNFYVWSRGRQSCRPEHLSEPAEYSDIGEIFYSNKDTILMLLWSVTLHQRWRQPSQ